MNRSVLLVICDFLILTLLSFIQFDSTSTESAASVEASPAPGVSAPAMSNMLATLQTALELERSQREALTNALAVTSAELSNRLRLLAEREIALTNVLGRLDQSESEARRLAEERARLDRARAEAAASVRELQIAFETTQRTADSLQDRLSDTTREAATAKAKLQSMEEELTRRKGEAQQMQQQIKELDASQEALKEEKFRLTTELRVTESQATVARQEVTNLTQQLVASGAEKAELIQTASRLATNVTVLSEQSTAIREQIEKQTRLPANQVYADYLTNRVRTEMTGTTRGALGQEVVRRRESWSALVRIGDQVHAVLHLESTPVRLWPPDAPWFAFTAGLSRGTGQTKPGEFALLAKDPRVAVLPVDDATVKALGARVYEVAKDAAQFSDAVVIGGEESYYGECAFRLNSETPGYVQMERSTLRRLMGDFSPRRGDLAFTKTGELLGILVNGDQCLLLNSSETLPAFRCAERLDAAANSQVLRSAQALLDRMPPGLR